MVLLIRKSESESESESELMMIYRALFLMPAGTTDDDDAAEVPESAVSLYVNFCEAFVGVSVIGRTRTFSVFFIFQTEPTPTMPFD